MRLLLASLFSEAVSLRLCAHKSYSQTPTIRLVKEYSELLFHRAAAFSERRSFSWVLVSRFSLANPLTSRLGGCETTERASVFTLSGHAGRSPKRSRYALISLGLIQLSVQALF